MTLTEIFKGVLSNGSHTSIFNKLGPRRVEIIFALLEMLVSWYTTINTHFFNLLRIQYLMEITAPLYPDAIMIIS